jgi:hypothetical protein
MQRARDGGMGKRDRGVSDSGNETTFPGGETMSDSVSRSDVLETYADLYDVFSDNKGIQEELNKVFDKINKLSSAQPVARDTNVLSNDTV